ncbi:MAG: sulfite exporter TauE/SafE family protein, partial [bacterium]
MSKKKVSTYCVSGMHCPSCEMLIQRKVSKLQGVTSAKINTSTEEIKILGKRHVLEEELNELFAGTEYAFGSYEEPRSFGNKMLEIGALALFILPVFLLLNHFEAFTNGVSVQDNMSFLVILGLGVVASFSSCIAVAGGLLLAVSTKYAKAHPNLTKSQKFKPHILFNIGRFISYIVFGALIGYVGSIITLTPALTGILTLIAAGLMVLIGLQLLGLIPPFSLVPKSISSKIMQKSDSSKKASLYSAFGFGALTFFLPCGFTQAMQLYVLGKGDPVFGAIAMAVFAIGTLPSFLSIGYLTSSMKKEWLHNISLISGIIVVFLGLFLLPSAMRLAATDGADISSTVAAIPSDAQTVPIVDGYQIAEMTVVGLSYEPHHFYVKKGTPVKWIIDGEKARGCGQVLT